ncbi:MAG: hypothetical protein DRP42_03705 [Tenericutes bacterium]|nr:MAG: hypothetical protein DRP42_03705 [Mycoplasmatota bacterium]
MNKKGGTFGGAVITILLVMALFYGTFDYISANYESANVTNVVGYNQSHADLEESQANLNENIESIKTSAQGIAEADGNALSIAWNGLTGIAGTLRLFISVIDVAVDVWNALLPGLSFLPTWVKLLIEMAIIIWIVLIIIGAFKGESKT